MKASIKKNSIPGRIFAALGVLGVLVAVFLSPLSNMMAEASALAVTKSVIVTLKGDPGAVWKAKQEKAGRSVSAADLQAYRDSIKAAQDNFLAALKARGIDYTVDGVDVPNFDGTNAGHVDFRTNLVLNSVTLQVPNAALAAISAMPQVKSVRPNKAMPLTLNKSVDYINAPASYGQYKELTQFDNFNEGYEGQNMNVAVLDTGIDWKHEMFGGDPTPPRLGLLPPTAAVGSNKKVIYYMTFTGGLIDDYGHGSAASSDIAGYLGMAPGADGLPGTLDDIKVHGVAPQARLMGYKVCLGVGSCLSASTIMALEDAVSPVSLSLQPKPIAHVINMSLGGAGTPDDDTALAADNAALLGTIVVASAGNSGPGENTIGSPSAGRHVISVAASTDPAAANETWSTDLLKASTIPANAVGAVTPANNLAAEPGYNRIRLYKMAESPDPAATSIAQRYAFVNLAAATATYPASVSGRIALIKDSGLASATFFDICNSAAANGAVAAILISTTTNPTAVKGLIPCSIVSPTDGQILIDALSSSDVNGTDPANGAVSELPIRINPYLNNTFIGSTASFSSRGPVAGLGQVKPDVTAPGVAVLSATIRAGSADANGGHMFDPTGYVLASGTSFSGPHVAGSVALIKQAHLDWSVDTVRTALINTSTNFRTANQIASPDGETTDSIIDQGGGLVDVTAAIRTAAIMGVEGDGIVEPSILGSHSFGEKAVLNNRITNTYSVPVVIRDLTGQGGTYTLSTANNRSTAQNGIVTGTSVSTVNVPAGGQAAFNATISIDGNVVRSTDMQELQWYVNATSASGKKIRMPMYLQATASLPSDAIATSTTDTYTGTVLVGDAGQQRDNELYVAGDVSYVDVPFNVPSSTLKLDGVLSFTVAQDVPGVTGLPDLDFLLFDPNGNQIGESAGSTNTEHIAVNTTIPGQYIWRVYGFIAAGTDFSIASTQLKGGSAPVVDPIAANFVETSTGNRYDFDGNVDVTWTPDGAVDAYEVEESTDGNNWNVIQTVAGSATGVSFTNVPDGTHNFRVRSIIPGRVGKFVTMPSNVVGVIVARRTEVDATSAVEALNRSITFPAGSTELVTALKNKGTTTLYPNVRFEITSISGSGVTVSNADNGGNGVTSVASFDYSQLVGSDFTPSEESGNKTLKFNNPNNTLFTFTARVIANVGSGAVPAGATSTQTQTSGGTSSTSSGSGIQSLGAKKVFKFTVNPLTRLITVQIL